MRLIARFFILAFALVVAITASSLFGFFASLIDPILAPLTRDALIVGFWSLADAIFALEDPAPVVANAAAGIGKLAFMIFVAPPLFIALVSEVIAARSFLWHVLAPAFITAILPWLWRGEARVASPGEIHVAMILALIGAVAGLVYWSIAGRSAGISAPTPSES